MFFFFLKNVVNFYLSIHSILSLYTSYLNFCNLELKFWNIQYIYFLNFKICMYLLFEFNTILIQEIKFDSQSGISSDILKLIG